IQESYHQPEIGLQQILSSMVALLDDASDLGVNLDSRVLGVIDFLSKISSQKDLFLLLTEGHGAQFFTHTPLAHHPARQVRCLLDVVARAGGHVFENQFFRHTPAKKNHEIVKNIFLLILLLLILLHLLPQSLLHTTRDNGDLMNRISSRK